MKMKSNEKVKDTRNLKTLPSTNDDLFLASFISRTHSPNNDDIKNSHQKILNNTGSVFNVFKPVSKTPFEIVQEFRMRFPQYSFDSNGKPLKICKNYVIVILLPLNKLSHSFIECSICRKTRSNGSRSSDSVSWR
jgi:hypothetical protein